MFAVLRGIFTVLRVILAVFRDMLAVLRSILAVIRGMLPLFRGVLTVFTVQLGIGIILIFSCFKLQGYVSCVSEIYKLYPRQRERSM